MKRRSLIQLLALIPLGALLPSKAEAAAVLSDPSPTTAVTSGVTLFHDDWQTMASLLWGNMVRMVSDSHEAWNAEELAFAKVVCFRLCRHLLDRQSSVRDMCRSFCEDFKYPSGVVVDDALNRVRFGVFLDAPAGLVDGRPVLAQARRLKTNIVAPIDAIKDLQAYYPGLDALVELTEVTAENCALEIMLEICHDAKNGSPISMYLLHTPPFVAPVDSALETDASVCRKTQMRYAKA